MRGRRYTCWYTEADSEVSPLGGPIPRRRNLAGKRPGASSHGAARQGGPGRAIGHPVGWQYHPVGDHRPPGRWGPWAGVKDRLSR